MVRLFRYDRAQRRTWVCGHRLHHGLVGALLIVLGLALCWDDRLDAPWTKDCA